MMKKFQTIALALVVASGTFACAKAKDEKDEAAKDHAPHAQSAPQDKREPPAKSVTATFDNLLAAVENNDFPAFVEPGTPEFQAAATEPMLQAVSDRLASRLKEGYQVTYFGQLKQKGFGVYLWKISFKDGGDDSLASLSLKEEKVGGFFIH